MEINTLEGLITTLGFIGMILMGIAFIIRTLSCNPYENKNVFAFSKEWFRYTQALITVGYLMTSFTLLWLVLK